MCVLIIPRDRAGSQPPTHHTLDAPPPEFDERLPGWDHYDNRPARRRARREHPSNPGRNAPQAALPNAGLSRLDRACINSPDYEGPCRRRLDRTRGITLNGFDRAIARRLIDRSERCLRQWAAKRRLAMTDGGLREQRMVHALRCHCRQCWTCETDRRERMKSRVAGAHRVFFTGTTPRERCSARDSWIVVGEARSAFQRELHRELAYASRELTGRTDWRGVRKDLRTEEARHNIRTDRKLELAWVLEEHKDGYAHLHMCLNIEWMDPVWTKALWARCLGVAWAICKAKRVWQADGVCWYLSTYISKGMLDVDVLAVMYRRRIFASTVRRAAQEKSGWTPDDEVNSIVAERLCEKRETVLEGQGWVLDVGRDGRYAIWSRPVDEDLAESLWRYQDSIAQRSELTGELSRQDYRPLAYYARNPWDSDDRVDAFRRWGDLSGILDKMEN